MKSFVARLAPRALVLVAFALASSIFHDVATVTTHRLYLSARTNASVGSTAVERFEVEAARVVPHIALRDADRIAFGSGGAWPTTLHVGVRPAGRARYGIHWRVAGADAVLARGESGTETAVSVPIPAAAGTIEFVNDGALTWVDPRTITDLRITKRAIALLLVVSTWVACWRRVRRRRADRPARIAVYKLTAAGASVLAAILGLEAGLRALGDHGPPPILAERHDLGEVRKDPRWEYTRRYGRRLRAGIDDVSEWRHGDIVRMGFIPAEVSDGVAHRFSFRTDAEGFRNDRTRDRIDVATLGDSFTDAMTIDAAGAWPVLLERRTGLAVQNYGTAGFGPQQELRVLTDFALRHRPRVVVVAFFAGNDIFDAEAFEEYDRSNGAVRPADPGWPIRDVVSRADTWFVTSTIHAARRWASTSQLAEARALDVPGDRPAAASVEAASFDRGMFTLPVHGRPLRFAFMPPYLNTLRMSEHDLAAREGWRLTRQAVEAMRDHARRAGAALVVMFLPSKSQIYLPLAAASLPRPDVERALRYSLPDGAIDIDAMLRNRRAQNQLMRRFCSEAAVPFLDTTDALEARVLGGENVYFPDESHLNELGHAIVAESLAAFVSAVRGR